jgi:predicted RNA-binding protein with PUA-like domain
MRHWLMKSEPDEFSIDDLARVGREPWSGVRNYQARNYMMKDMRVGDGVLFYHSSTAIPGVAGLAEVASEPYPDPTQFARKSDYYDPASRPEQPRWWLVDIAFRRKLARVVALDELRAVADRLGDIHLLQRGNRLSIMPLSAAQWRTILSLEKA